MDIFRNSDLIDINHYSNNKLKIIGIRLVLFPKNKNYK